MGPETHRAAVPADTEGEQPGVTRHSKLKCLRQLKDDSEMRRSATAGRGKWMALTAVLALGCSVYDESMLNPDAGAVVTVSMDFLRKTWGHAVGKRKKFTDTNACSARNHPETMARATCSL